ncbi:hypothetical protein NMY22_g6666 [Coprinellus aureogranulatus]|nr:hypothetical protein NMY22_g6666 [Coprinellus aureogranulatus]
MVALSSLFLLLLPTAALAANFTVAVGKDRVLTIEPNFVRAEVGDQIFFDMYYGGHTITASSFEAPCTRSQSGNGFVGQYGSVDSLPGPSHQVETRYIMDVTSADPAWYFCAQTCGSNHCQEGMLFALNPPDDQPFEQFLRNARNQEGLTVESGSCETRRNPTPTTTSTGTTTTTTQGSTPSTTSANTGTGENSALSRVQFAFNEGPSFAVLAVIAHLML